MEWIISTALIHSNIKQDKSATNAPGSSKENQVTAGLKSILKKIGGGNDSDNQDNLKRWEHSMFSLKRHKGKKFYIFGGSNKTTKTKFNNLLEFSQIDSSKQIQWQYKSIPLQQYNKLLPSAREGHTTVIFVTNSGEDGEDGTSTEEELVCLFGGYDGQRYLNDLWILNPRNWKWQKIFDCTEVDEDNDLVSMSDLAKGGGNTSTSTNTKSLAAQSRSNTIFRRKSINLRKFSFVHKKDSNTSTFGGTNTSTNYNELTAGAGSNGESETDYPCPRSEHSAVVLNDSTMWIFGGFNGTKPLQDVWSFDFETNEWFRVLAKANSDQETAIPSARYGHTSDIVSFQIPKKVNPAQQASAQDVVNGPTTPTSPVKKPKFNEDDEGAEEEEKDDEPEKKGKTLFETLDTKQYMVICFGIVAKGKKFSLNQTEYSDEVWAFDFDELSWRKMNPLITGALPDGRYGHSSASIGRGCIMVFGGYASPHFKKDCYVIDIANGKSAQLEKIKSSWPRARKGQTSFYDPNQKAVIMFGGGSLKKGNLEDICVLYTAPVFKTLHIGISDQLKRNSVSDNIKNFGSSKKEKKSRGKSLKSIASLNAKIEKSPEDHVLFYKRSKAYLALNLPEKALIDIEKSLSKDTLSSKYKIIKGEVLLALNRAKEAIPIFSSITRAEKDSILIMQARAGRAKAFYAINQFRTAVTDAQEALKIYEDIPDKKVKKKAYESLYETYKIKSKGHCGLKEFEIAAKVAEQAENHLLSKKNHERKEFLLEDLLKLREFVSKKRRDSESAEKKIALARLILEDTENKDVDKAINYLEQAKEKDELNPEVYGFLAEAYYKKQAFKECKSYAKQLVKLDCNNHRGYYFLGLAYINLRKVSKAIDTLSDGLENCEDHTDLLKTVIEDAKRREDFYDKASKQDRMASQFEENEDYQKALDSIEVSVKLDPANAKYTFHKTNILTKLGRYEEALDHAKIGTNLAPLQPQGYLQQASCCIMLKKFKQAVTILQLGLEKLPGNQGIERQLERAKEFVRKEDQANFNLQIAIEQLQKLEKENKNLTYEMLSSDAAELDISIRGEIEKAYSAISNSIHLIDYNLEAYYWQAKALYLLRRFIKCAQSCKCALDMVLIVDKNNPDSAYRYQNVTGKIVFEMIKLGAKANASFDQYAIAVDFIKQMKKLSVKLMTKDFDKELDQLASIIDQKQSDNAKFEKYLRKGRNMFGLKDYQRALKSLTKALEYKQNLEKSTSASVLSVYYERALVYYEMGDFENSMAGCQRAMSMTTMPHHVFLFVKDLLKQKRISEALDQLKNALNNLYPYNSSLNEAWKVISQFIANEKASVLLEEAKSAIAAYQYETAVDKLNECIHLNPTCKEAYVLRAQSLFTCNKMTKALKDVETCIENNPKNSDMHYLKGKILIKLQRFEEAIKTFQHVMELSPILSDNANSRLDEITQIQAQEDKAKKLCQKAEQLLKNSSIDSDMYAVQNAYDLYTKAITLSPVNPALYIRRSELAMQLMDYKSALQDASNAVQIDASLSKGYVMKVKCLLQACKYDEAEKVLQEAMDMDDQSDELCALEEEVQEYRKNAQLANEHHDKGVKQLKKYLGGHKKALKRAQENLYKATKYEPMNKDFSRDYIVFLINHGKDQNEAFFNVETLIKLNPDYVEALELKANIELQQGNTLDALVTCTNALEKEPLKMPVLHYVYQIIGEEWAKTTASSTGKKAQEQTQDAEQHQEQPENQGEENEGTKPTTEVEEEDESDSRLSLPIESEIPNHHFEKRKTASANFINNTIFAQIQLPSITIQMTGKENAMEKSIKESFSKTFKTIDQTIGTALNRVDNTLTNTLNFGHKVAETVFAPAKEAIQLEQQKKKRKASFDFALRALFLSDAFVPFCDLLSELFGITPDAKNQVIRQLASQSHKTITIDICTARYYLVYSDQHPFYKENTFKKSDQYDYWKKTEFSKIETLLARHTTNDLSFLKSKLVSYKPEEASQMKELISSFIEDVFACVMENKKLMLAVIPIIAAVTDLYGFGEWIPLLQFVNFLTEDPPNSFGDLTTLYQIILILSKKFLDRDTTLTEEQEGQQSNDPPLSLFMTQTEIEMFHSVREQCNRCVDFVMDSHYSRNVISVEATTICIKLYAMLQVIHQVGTATPSLKKHSFLFWISAKVHHTVSNVLDHFKSHYPRKDHRYTEPNVLLNIIPQISDFLRDYEERYDKELPKALRLLFTACNKIYEWMRWELKRAHKYLVKENDPSIPKNSIHTVIPEGIFNLPKKCSNLHEFLVEKSCHLLPFKVTRLVIPYVYCYMNQHEHKLLDLIAKCQSGIRVWKPKSNQEKHTTFVEELFALIQQGKSFIELQHSSLTRIYAAEQQAYSMVGDASQVEHSMDSIALLFVTFFDCANHAVETYLKELERQFLVTANVYTQKKALLKKAKVASRTNSKGTFSAAAKDEIPIYLKIIEELVAKMCLIVMDSFYCLQTYYTWMRKYDQEEEVKQSMVKDALHMMHKRCNGFFHKMSRDVCQELLELKIMKTIRKMVVFCNERMKQPQLEQQIDKLIRHLKNTQEMLSKYFDQEVFLITLESAVDAISLEWKEVMIPALQSSRGLNLVQLSMLKSVVFPTLKGKLKATLLLLSPSFIDFEFEVLDKILSFYNQNTVELIDMYEERLKIMEAKMKKFMLEEEKRTKAEHERRMREKKEKEMKLKALQKASKDHHSDSEEEEEKEKEEQEEEEEEEDEEDAPKKSSTKPSKTEEDDEYEEEEEDDEEPQPKKPVPTKKPVSKNDEYDEEDDEEEEEDEEPQPKKPAAKPTPAKSQPAKKPADDEYDEGDDDEEEEEELAPKKAPTKTPTTPASKAPPKKPVDDEYDEGDEDDEEDEPPKKKTPTTPVKKPPVDDEYDEEEEEEDEEQEEVLLKGKQNSKSNNDEYDEDEQEEEKEEEDEEEEEDESEKAKTLKQEEKKEDKPAQHYDIEEARDSLESVYQIYALAFLQRRAKYDRDEGAANIVSRELEAFKFRSTQNEQEIEKYGNMIRQVQNEYYTMKRDVEQIQQSIEIVSEKNQYLKKIQEMDAERKQSRRYIIDTTKELATIQKEKEKLEKQLVRTRNYLAKEVNSLEKQNITYKLNETDYEIVVKSLPIANASDILTHFKCMHKLHQGYLFIINNPTAMVLWAPSRARGSLYYNPTETQNWLVRINMKRVVEIRSVAFAASVNTAIELEVRYKLGPNKNYVFTSFENRMDAIDKLERALQSVEGMEDDGDDLDDMLGGNEDSDNEEESGQPITTNALTQLGKTVTKFIGKQLDMIGNKAKNSSNNTPTDKTAGQNSTAPSNVTVEELSLTGYVVSKMLKQKFDIHSDNVRLIQKYFCNEATSKIPANLYIFSDQVALETTLVNQPFKIQFEFDDLSKVSVVEKYNGIKFTSKTGKSFTCTGFMNRDETFKSICELIANVSKKKLIYKQSNIAVFKKDLGRLLNL